MSRHRLLRFVYWGVVLCLFLPLALVALASLGDGPVVGFPIARPTLGWYAIALADPEIVRAFLVSCAAAVASTALALAMGLWTSLAIASLASPALRTLLLCGACLPLVTPGIISAISLRIYIRLLGIDPGLGAIVLGHAIHSAPYVVIVVGLRLRLVPPHLVEAARSLGAGQIRAFCSVTLPWLRPAIGAAAVLALLESFDDFLRSFFLGGYRPTLPVLIYGRLFSGLSPEIGAIATLVLALTLSVGLSGEWLFWRTRTPQGS